MGIERVRYNSFADEVLKQLEKGVFLTSKFDDQVNTMTIGWGSISYIWGMPIFMVAVRYSRHTYNLIDKSKEFTVSVPLRSDLSKELEYFGTHSGKNVDKYKKFDLKLVEGQKVSTPIIADCELHFECKVVYQQAMEPATVSIGIKENYYSSIDYHVLYFGQIVDTYFYY